MYRKLLIIIICVAGIVCSCSKKAETAMDEDGGDVIVFKNTAVQSATDAAYSVNGFELSTENNNDTSAYTFTEDMNSDVKAFIRQYYDYLAAGDYDLAAYMTNDSSRLSKDVFLQKSELIESIESLTCYMMEGMIDRTYIVVARCGLKTSLGDPIVFSMEAFYVCTNESGTFYICGGGAGDEVMSYNSIMLSNQRILEILAEVGELNSEAERTQDSLAEAKGIIYSDEIFRYLYEQPAAQQ